MFALVLALTSTAPAAFVDDFTNLDGWIPFGEARALHDTRESVSGNGRSLHVVTAQGPGGVERKAPLEVEAGDRFSAAITVRTSDPAYLEVIGVPGEIALGRDKAQTDGEFDELAVKAAVPEGVSALRVRLVINAAHRKQNWWDRFAFDPKLLSDAPVATTPEPTGPDPIELAARRSAYTSALARTKWDGARKVDVHHAGKRDDALAVVVPVDARRGISYAVVDTAGHPIPVQCDDLDGDGAVDEVCFLLPVKAGATRSGHLLSTRAALPDVPRDLELETITTGPWAPIRMQPTRGYGTTQHSTYLSSANVARARRLLERMEKPEAMVRVRCPDFQVLIGRETERRSPISSSAPPACATRASVRRGSRGTRNTRSPPGASLNPMHGPWS